MAGAALLAAGALQTWRWTREGARTHPPRGRFLTLGDTKLHYIDSDPGEAQGRTNANRQAVVLLHGAGAMVADMEISGLFAALARDYRVIAIDRPGYGHSPRLARFTNRPARQAALYTALITELGLRQPIVLGHSWGTLPALAMALDFAPRLRGLVLVSGHYFDAGRKDAAILSLPASPWLGVPLRHALAAPFIRLSKGYILRRTFAPQPVPAAFQRTFPFILELRASQIQTAGEELRFLDAGARTMQTRYADIRVPVEILAGDSDCILNSAPHSRRLHAALPQSGLEILPGIGHMLHYFALDRVLSAFARIARTAA